jgi:hypothetical protein
VPHLPAAGEIVIFDRSWYNRAGVERVMGFCTPEQVEKFLDGTPVMEKAMVDAGIILLKYWLEVTPKEQERRLRDRINDGRKIWKLSPMDIKSFNLWDDYTVARDAMFAATDTAWAPWFVARSEDKKRVRLNIISHLLTQIPYKELHVEPVELPKRKIGKVKPTKYPSGMSKNASDITGMRLSQNVQGNQYCFCWQRLIMSAPTGGKNEIEIRQQSVRPAPTAVSSRNAIVHNCHE